MRLGRWGICHERGPIGCRIYSLPVDINAVQLVCPVRIDHRLHKGTAESVVGSDGTKVLTSGPAANRQLDAFAGRVSGRHETVEQIRAVPLREFEAAGSGRDGECKVHYVEAIPVDLFGSEVPGGPVGIVACHEGSGYRLKASAGGCGCRGFCDRSGGRGGFRGGGSVSAGGRGGR